MRRCVEVPHTPAKRSSASVSLRVQRQSKARPVLPAMVWSTYRLGGAKPSSDAVQLPRPSGAALKILPQDCRAQEARRIGLSCWKRVDGGRPRLRSPPSQGASPYHAVPSAAVLRQRKDLPFEGADAVMIGSTSACRAGCILRDDTMHFESALARSVTSPAIRGCSPWTRSRKGHLERRDCAGSPCHTEVTAHVRGHYSVKTPRTICLRFALDSSFPLFHTAAGSHGQGTFGKS